MESIRSLLASVSLGYPVGTVMMLRTGGVVRFKSRPIEGAESTKEPERLILDGQQRITSLFQALSLGLPIRTQDARKRQLHGWFYIDMDAALDERIDREEAFRFIPADRIVRSFRSEVELDLSSPDDEYKHCMFPVAALLDSEDWMDGFDDHWDGQPEKRQLRKRFRKEILAQFREYQVPVIELGSQTARQAVCQVFEKVNTGGVTLTVFELLTATYAADEFDLRRDWENRRKSWSGREFKVLRGVANTDFLQTVTLLATRDERNAYLQGSPDDDRGPRIGCRRSDILNLPLASYKQWAPAAEQGFIDAAKLMQHLHVFDTRFLPYGSQLIPLAAIFAALGSAANTLRGRNLIEKWVWCGVFGELYGGTTETRFTRDLPEVEAWVLGSVEQPRTVQEAVFSSRRIDTLRTRGSAAYKGLYALILAGGASDWSTGEKMSATTYFDDHVDIHHVFPRAWCLHQGIEPVIFNSIANKTPLTARTNRIIGGKSPSEYLHRLIKNAGVDRGQIDAHIQTHHIEIQQLERNDFNAFMATRRAAFASLIADAMGKAIEADSLVEDVFEPDPPDDDLDDE